MELLDAVYNEHNWMAIDSANLQWQVENQDVAIYICSLIAIKRAN